MSLSKIKTAVDTGKNVYWLNRYFPVVNENGNYRIKSSFNGKSIELHDEQGILSCKPEHFIVE